MTEPGEPTTRGIAALCAATGQFALLLDEAFDIVWHTPTLTTILASSGAWLSIEAVTFDQTGSWPT